jgi:aminoglycoside phosphotransferase (APT) family kinase protein
LSALALTEERVLGIVRTLFPTASIASWQPIPGEHENVLTILLLSDRTEIVLKIYVDDPDLVSYSREAQLLRMITAETGVPVPRVLSHGAQLPWEQTGEEAHPWLLLSRLPGIPLQQVIGALEETELEALGYELGRYLAHLHQIPLETFGCVLGTGPHDRVTEKDYVLSQVADWLTQCEAAGLLAPGARSILRRRFAETDALDRSQACLTHAALSARTVMVESGVTGYHVTGFLDLSRAQGGSPELDVAGLFACDFQAVPAAQKGFLDGYTDSGELSPRFWDRLGLYQAFVSLRTLLVAHRKGDPGLMWQATEQIQHYLDSPRTDDHGNPDSPEHV